MNDQLKNKNILFLCGKEYGYYAEIISELEKLESNVIYYPIERKNYFTVFFRLFYKKIFILLAKRYSDNILKKVEKTKFDYIFVIHGFQLPKQFYITLKRRNPNAIFLNYTWDSIRKTHYNNTIIEYLDLFDRAYSFDSTDCSTYGKQIYLPLFYIKDYSANNNTSDYLYDIAFIGSLSTEIRYKYIKKISEYCDNNNLSFFYYLRIARPFFFKSILMGKSKFDVHFKPIDNERIINIYKKSKVVIDIPGQTQSGLTMRTIEVLAMGKKLITTNKNIKKEPFYHPKYIKIIDFNNINEIKSFINKESFTPDMSNYSLEKWIKKIFNI